MSPENSSRSESAKKSWQDPEKKADRVAAIHNDKQRRGTKESWGRLSPEEWELRVRRTVDGRKKTREAKIAAHLGEDPKQILKTWVEEGLSALEIASITGLSRFKIRGCLKEAGLKPNKRTTLVRNIIDQRYGLVKLAGETDLIQYLLPKDREVIGRRFGSKGQVTSLEEIAKKFGVTRERIRQREARGLSVLEKMLSGDNISPLGWT